MEKDNAKGAYSGTKGKIDFAASLGYASLSGSIGQEFTQFKDKTPFDGKIFKLVAGADIGTQLDYNYGRGFESVSKASMYLQLALFDGLFKMKWSLLKLKLTPGPKFKLTTGTGQEF